MIKREQFEKLVLDQLRVHPVAALLGPRQCGKTTLAMHIAKTYKDPVHLFDLENPQDLLALTEPMRVLERLKGLVVIDEIQRLPSLFPILRVLVDKLQTRFLILGSASRDLIQQSSETLAGRIGYIEMTPLQLKEVFDVHSLLLRGGFPRSFLAASMEDSLLWREAYIQTFLERDIPNLGFNIPSLQLRRFWMMLTHVHGQLLNKNMLATSLNITSHTVSHYMDILAGTFMLRILSPWHSNISKRQVKTPKIYFRDSGLLLSLLGIKSEDDLLHHPALGAIWEGFALEQVILTLKLRQEETFFWRTAHGAELDLLVFNQGKRLGFEFKFADAPKTSKSMHIAIEDLDLDYLYIIYPGEREIPFSEKITALGFESWISNNSIN